MLLVILKLKQIFNWIKKNIAAVIPSILLVGMILFHFFYTYNPPLMGPIIVSPETKSINLDNGQSAQVKVNTPETNSPEEAGFSKEFINDTINKIMGIKDKQILSINKVTGKYIDTLKYVREELDAEQRKVTYYESKNAAGRVIGSGKVVDGSKLDYSADVDLVNVVKKASSKNDRDSLVFYDPDQRFTIKGSKEYKYAVPEKTVIKRWTFGISAGAGVVIPQFDTKKATFGGYIGGSISYNFK